MNAVKSCCPFCNQHVEHPAEMAGQSVKCPTCGHEIKLGVIRAPSFEHAPSHRPGLHPETGHRDMSWFRPRAY